MLKDVFGAGAVDNMARLAEDSDACRDLCEARVFAAARNATSRQALGLRCDLGGFRGEGAFFWRTALADVADVHGLGRLSRKAVSVVSKKVASRSSGWLELKKGWRASRRRRPILAAPRSGRRVQRWTGGHRRPRSDAGITRRHRVLVA